MKKIIGPAIILVALVIYGVAQAGSLTPSAAPAATMFTLEDIFNRLSTNVDATEGSHPFSIATSPAASMRTLIEIYEAIPPILAETIKLGISYLGIAGTLTPDGGTAAETDLFTGTTAHLSGDWVLDIGTLTLACDTDTFDGIANLVDDKRDGEDGDGSNRWCMDDSGTATDADIRIGTTAWINGVAVNGTLNPEVNLTNMYSGSGSGYTGGSEGNGGTDDYNAGGDIPEGRYVGTWTICDTDNNWCDTGLVSASAQDMNTGLIWSYRCSGIGCSSFDDDNPTKRYGWDGTYMINGGLTANELCSGGGHGETGWYLPDQRQLMQAYINGSLGNLIRADSDRQSHWSGTTTSFAPTTAWQIHLSHGYTKYLSKSGPGGDVNQSYIRCVR